MSNNIAINTTNLSKVYSGFTALDNLTIAIPEGSCVGFVGPNGAGKSTTIKILTGLLNPSNGTAEIFGYDVKKEKKKALALVGTVVETPEFFPQFTPKECLEYFGKIRGLSGEKLQSRIKKVLEMVNMTDWSKKKVGKFSKGMKQRVALASALLNDPELIILDEPTSGLDPRGIIEVRNIIKLLKKEKKTVFMSSHLLKETQEICDKVALINKGKLMRYDDISNIKLESKQNSVIFVESLNEISKEQIEKITQMEMVKQAEMQDSTKFTISFQGNLEEKNNILKKLEEVGIKVVEFKTIENQLESLYMDLVEDSVR